MQSLTPTTPHGCLQMPHPQPSRTPSSLLLCSVMPTALLSSPRPPSPCLNLRTRPSSPVDADVQAPNYGASISGHNISLTPPLAPPWLHSKPSAPMISQALRCSYITYTPPLASLSTPPGLSSEKPETTPHGMVSPTRTPASTAPLLPRPSTATRRKPIKACAHLSVNAPRPIWPPHRPIPQTIPLCCPTHFPMNCMYMYITLANCTHTTPEASPFALSAEISTL